MHCITKPENTAEEQAILVMYTKQKAGV